MNESGQSQPSAVYTDTDLSKTGQRIMGERKAHSLRRPGCAAQWSVKPIFAWYDLWVGIFWDSRKRKLYILPLPCVGVVIEFPDHDSSKGTK